MRNEQRIEQRGGAPGAGHRKGSLAIAALFCLASSTVAGAAAAQGVSAVAVVDEAEALLDEAAVTVISDAEISRLVPRSIDPRRSLFVTELKALQPFSLQRVMDQLAAQTGQVGLTGIDLFRQLWDTQNPAPGVGDGPHCDDELDASGEPNLNGYPYDCRPAPAEGQQAECTSFDEPGCQYQPVAVVNRFDLASADTSTCGEYRIIHAKRGSGPLDRNFIIWEAALPNPLPRLGREGCRRLAVYWGLLSRVSDIEVRSKWLERFYFRGLSGAQPVVHINHYGRNGRGQVRTNQFMQSGGGFVWTLREFKLVDGGAGTGWLLDPSPDAVNPWGGLFSPESTHAQTDAFARFLPTQLNNLSASDLNGITMVVPDQFNSGQSHASGSTDTSYLVQFGSDESALRTALQDAIAAAGLSLTVEQVVSRAQTQTCAGCHELSAGADLGDGLTWPASAGFTHVNELAIENVEGLDRFDISPALKEVFLPGRKRILEDFLFRNRITPAAVGAVN